MKRKKIHYAWWIWISCIAIAFFSSGVLGTQGIFLRPVISDLNISATQFSIFFTAMSLAMFASLPLTGKLLKRYDHRLILSAAILFQGSAQAAMGLYQSIHWFYVSAAFMGAAAGITLVMIIPLLVQQWFYKKIATLTGVALAFSGIGAAVLQPLGTALIAAYGWRMTYFIFAAVILLGTLPFTIFLIRTRPADKGLKRYGEPEQKETQELADNVITTKDVGMSAKEAYKNPLFYLLAAFAACVGYGVSFQTHIPNLAASLGVDFLKTGIIASVASLSMMIAKMINGSVNDRFGIKISVGFFSLFGLAAAVLTWYVLAALPSNVLFFSALIAACMGIYFSVPTISTPVISQIVFRGNDYSLIYAKISMFYILASALGGTINGVLFDLNQNYFLNFIVMAAVILAAVVLAISVSVKMKEKQRT